MTDTAAARSGPEDGAGLLVWYAAYGSNLRAARFSTYLTGGPVPGSTGRIQPGARDPEPPRDEATMTVPHRLRFARRSTSWGGGGVAFLDADPPAGPSPGDRPTRPTRLRLWLVTLGQFADVAAQENGRPPGAVDINPAGLAGLIERGHLDVDPGWYGRILDLGRGPAGHRVVTVTAPRVAPPNPPHRSYVEVIVAGLMESFGLDEDDARLYIRHRIEPRDRIDGV
ncbi:MAG: histone deacetylase [Acidimicrobiales bacterium]